MFERLRSITQVEYKWKAFSVTSVGALMSAADTTIVLLALLPIAENLHTDYITIVWVILAYLLVNTSLVLTLGRIGDIRGRKRMYNIGFVVFTIGSALSGLAGTGLTLVIYRVIQGVGAAMLTATCCACLYHITTFFTAGGYMWTPLFLDQQYYSYFIFTGSMFPYFLSYLGE